MRSGVGAKQISMCWGQLSEMPTGGQGRQQEGTRAEGPQVKWGRRRGECARSPLDGHEGEGEPWSIGGIWARGEQGVFISPTMGVGSAGSAVERLTR